MITPSFSLTATERVLPKLALDFTTASLDSRVTFTRTGNTATVTNSSGNIVGINANLPRFDFDPTTLVCKGLLIEEARTNINTYASGSFVNMTNGYFNSGTLSTTISAPDNTNTAQQFSFGTVGIQNIFKSITVFPSTVYSWSFYYKLGTLPESEFKIALRDDISGVFIILDLVPTKTTFNNGWVRASYSFTTPALCVLLRVYLIRSTMTTGGTIAFWGSQLEVGAFATSYIPTEATAVTRNADVATMTGTNFSDWYTATTGAASVWAIPQTATGTRPVIQFDDTTANEIIALRGNVANPELYIVDGGTPQAQIDAGTIVANTVYKLTGAWNTDSCAAAQNGAAVVTDDTATIPTPTQLRIGSDGTNYASAWVQKIYYYPQRLINAEVQSFSK